MKSRNRAFRPKGTDNPNSKINFEIAENIRRGYCKGLSRGYLSKKHKLCFATISNIINYKVWKVED